MKNISKDDKKAQMIVTVVRDESGPRRLYLNEAIMSYFGNRNQLIIEKERDGCIKIAETGKVKAAFISDFDKKQAVTYSKAAAKAFEELFDTSAYEIISVSGWKEIADCCLIYDPNEIVDHTGEEGQHEVKHENGNKP